MKIPEDKINLTISHWQIAADGIWETARQIEVNPNDLDNILEWVDNASNDIALEAFFGNKEDNFMFFGIRIEALSKEEKKLFLNHILQNINDTDTIKEVVTLSKTSIDQKPDLMELGAEGFWKSHGSYIVWKNGDDRPATVDKINKQAPQIIQPFKRPMMLEFAWNATLPSWIGIPVSNKYEKHYQFSAEKYNHLVNQV